MEAEDLSVEEQDVFKTQLNSQAFDEVSLNEKFIEPDTTIEPEFLSRNLQLGNIDKRDFKHYSHNVESAFVMFEIPFALGGFLSKEIGKSIMKSLHFSLVMSNSIDGNLREQSITKKNVFMRGKQNALKKSMGNNIKPLDE